jgi:general secretion pathway protein A
MNYYAELGLQKEPFSTSPDPYFFYRSATHRSALAKLEIAIRLKRGLSIVLGDVGTGKTTLARTLVQSFSEQDPFDFYMIFDPNFNTECQFLSVVSDLFKVTAARRTAVELKRAIENFLFEKSFTGQRSIVLMLDEAQKLSPAVLEVLRTFLNYETNDQKLIQVILFSQIEILPKLKLHENFYDRISFKYHLRPLALPEIHEMIEYRLTQAGWPAGKMLFAPDAIKEIYACTQGKLRKTTQLCHQSLLKLMFREKKLVDQSLISEIIQEEQDFLNAQRIDARRETAQTY